MISSSKDLFTFHSKQEFRSALIEHLIQYCRDTFGEYPEELLYEISSEVDEYIHHYEYPLYAIEGLSRQDLSRIISQLFESVSFFAGNLMIEKQLD